MSNPVFLCHVSDLRANLVRYPLLRFVRSNNGGLGAVVQVPVECRKGFSSITRL